MNPDVLLEVKDLKKYFPVRRGLLRKKVAEVKAVDEVSLILRKGETLGLVGESGCGKSTLGRSIIRLYEPTSGTITFRGRDFGSLRGSDLRRERRHIQMIFQDPFASLDPRMTVGALLEQPLKVHGLGNKEERRAKVEELIQLVGLKPFHLNRYPHEFSGGQRQRISIARALALNPDLIVADEAVSALDVSVQAQVLNLLCDLHERFRMAILFISHDINVIEHMCDRIAVMYLGRVVEEAPRDAFFAEPRHPYTQGLLGAVPEIGRKQAGPTIQGEIPSPLNPPTGCTFHTRCPHKKPICSERTPALRPLPGTEHRVACWLYEENTP